MSYRIKIIKFPRLFFVKNLFFFIKWRHFTENKNRIISVSVLTFRPFITEGPYLMGLDIRLVSGILFLFPVDIIPYPLLSPIPSQPLVPRDHVHHLKFWGPRIVSVFLFIYFQRDATLHSSFILGKLLYMFRVVSPLIIRSTHNCIYSIWYFSNRCCYLALLWKRWSWSECGAGIVPICDVGHNSHTTLRPAPTLPQ